MTKLDLEAIKFDVVMPKMRDEPNAHKRACFRAGYEAALIAQEAALVAADELAEAVPEFLADWGGDRSDYEECAEGTCAQCAMALRVFDALAAFRTARKDQPSQGADNG